MGRDFLGGEHRGSQHHSHFPPVLFPGFWNILTCHYRGLGLLVGGGVAGRGLNTGGGARGNISLQVGPKQPEVGDHDHASPPLPIPVPWLPPAYNPDSLPSGTFVTQTDVTQKGI